jgi:hypothetical protein
MTHKRPTHYLLAAIMCFLFCIMILVNYGWTSEIEVHPAVYVTAKTNSGLGYDTGFGVLGEVQARYDWAEVKLNGSYAWQKKSSADSGNTYGLSGQFRGYFYDGFYGLGAVRWSGYTSKFSDHGPWKKSGTNLGVGAGWSNTDIDLYLTYYFPENSTPNKVSFMPLNLRLRLWKWLWLMTEFGPEWFTQGDDNRTGFFFTGGLGARW